MASIKFNEYNQAMWGKLIIAQLVVYNNNKDQNTDTENDDQDHSCKGDCLRDKT